MVVGWILVTHDGNGGLRSCDHRHGGSVKNGVKRGSEAECYLKIVTAFLRLSFLLSFMCDKRNSGSSGLRVARK